MLIENELMAKYTNFLKSMPEKPYHQNLKIFILGRVEGRERVREQEMGRGQTESERISSRLHT